MSHYIYLIQVREFVANNEPTYKIGKTTQEPFERFKGYPSGSKVCLIIGVHDCHSLEKEIIQDFHKIFVFRKEYGNETFSGDVYYMCDIICCHAKKEHIKYKTIEDNKIIRRNISNIKTERIKNADNTPKLLIGTSSDNNIDYGDYFDNLDIFENSNRIKSSEISSSDAQQSEDIDDNSEIPIIKVVKKTPKGPKKTLETFYKYLYISNPDWYKDNAQVNLEKVVDIYTEYFEGTEESRSVISKKLAKLFVNSKRTKGITQKQLLPRDKLKKLF